MIFEPSDIERLILINQYAILAKLEPENAADHQLMEKRIRDGYYQQVEFHMSFDTPLPADVHEEVYEILQLHRALNTAKTSGNVDPSIDDRDIEYRGFDGNHETAYFGYANHILNSEDGMFQESASGTGNAHMAMLPRYRRMLDAWKQSQDRYQLTKDDVARIVTEGKNS